MDERTIKRLLVIFVVCVIAIMLAKKGVLSTYTTLNQAAAEKKANAAATAPAPSAASEVIEVPAVPAAGAASALMEASAVPEAPAGGETKEAAPAVSGVGDAR